MTPPYPIGSITQEVNLCQIWQTDKKTELVLLGGGLFIESRNILFVKMLGVSSHISQSNYARYGKSTVLSQEPTQSKVEVCKHHNN